MGPNQQIFRKRHPEMALSKYSMIPNYVGHILPAFGRDLTNFSYI